MDMIFEVQRLSHVSGLESEAHKDELNEHVSVCFLFVLETKNIFMFHCKGLARIIGFMKKGVL